MRGTIHDPKIATNASHAVAFAEAYVALEEAKARKRHADDQHEKAKRDFADALGRLHGHASVAVEQIAKANS